MSHYSAFVRSGKDYSQWFHVDDSKVNVIIQYQKQSVSMFFQVLPVSVANVTMQDPFMVFYELDEGWF